MSQAQIISFPAPTVSLINGRPATTSLEVAKFFGKRHNNVVRDVCGRLEYSPAEMGVLNFEETPYIDEQNGQTYPMFTIYFDGFILLAMGYTGKKAMQIKLAYIMAFNAMKEHLDKLAAEERAQLPADVNPSFLTPAQQSQLHALVAAKVGMLPKEAHRKAYSEIWSRFGRHFQVAKYQQLCPSRMGEAVEYLVSVELKVAQRELPPATTVVPLPASNAMNEVEQRIIALHAHVVKERHSICVDMGLAVWQTYGGDVLASMFHAIYTCVDKAIMNTSSSLSSYDLPVDLARRIAGLKVSASGARMQGL